MVDDKFRIEVVCLANVERSPMACAVGQKWVVDNGLSERIEVYSSGTNVSSSYSFGADVAVRILRRGSEAEALGSTMKESITTLIGGLKDEEALRNYDTNFVLRKAMELLARQVIADLTSDGKEKRNRVLGEHGLLYDEESRQTIADGRSRLILPITEGLCIRVESIYQNEGKGNVPLPQLHSLPTYSGVQGKYEGTLGAPIEVFREVFETLNKAVPLALERAVRELVH